MSKFDRKKIAVALAFMALFGSKSSAMNTNKNQVKSPQTLGTVGGRLIDQIRILVIEIYPAMLVLGLRN
ncbi:MAG: hypothetical protein J6P21_01045 [Clostridia bacterium]|nr:hypothetical protein [Clostridia bacterium]